MQERQADQPVRDQEGALLPGYVRAVQAALEAKDWAAIRALTQGLHEADVADLIQVLRPEERADFVSALGPKSAAPALTELDEQVRDQVLEALPNKQIVEAIRELDSDEAVYLIEDLAEPDKSQILSQLPRDERSAIERSLEYPPDSAGRLMQTEFIAVPPFWSVGQTIDFMRDQDDLPDHFSEIYVVDPAHHLFGRVALDRLLRSKRPVTVESITDKDVRTFLIADDQEEVAREFERYNMIAAPVVDQNRRLVGVVTADDILEVVQEEAEEDIHRMGGVGDESIGDTVLGALRSRFRWLLVNAGTAGLAAYVISLFEATINQMVALAVLMPIVASMGGNAGTQTLTVAVRALATRELGRVNAPRVIMREAAVGLLNGLAFSILVGLGAFLWFGNDELGYVIAAAIVINFFVAALAGILIPLALEALDIDPAIASGVFVTTVTDVVGFFAFLGLATLWLL